MSFQLPSDLLEAWEVLGKPETMSTYAHVPDDEETAMFIMADKETVEGWRDTEKLVQLQMVLYAMAPVIRVYYEIRDDPKEPFKGEAFFNVNDPHHRADFVRLSEQDRFVFHFFDVATQEYLYSNAVSWSDQQRVEVLQMLEVAERHAAYIGSEDYDFDTAKMLFQQHY